MICKIKRNPYLELLSCTLKTIDLTIYCINLARKEQLIY